MTKRLLVYGSGRLRRMVFPIKAHQHVPDNHTHLAGGTTVYLQMFVAYDLFVNFVIDPVRVCENFEGCGVSRVYTLCRQQQLLTEITNSVVI